MTRPARQARRETPAFRCTVPAPSRVTMGHMRIGRPRPRDESGISGPVRAARRPDLLLDRLQPGDVAVVDVLDLDRRTAEKLAGAGVVAVVNAAPSSSGRFPVRGAAALVEAGVPLVDDVGGEFLTRVRDGDVVRVDQGGDVWLDDELVGTGRVQTAESVVESDVAAREGLHTRVAALVADAGRRLSSAPLPEIDGTSFPDLRTDLDGATVVVIAPGATDSELRAVRRLRGRRTVVVGVGAGADRADGAGVAPDVVVLGKDARPGRISRRTPEVLVLDGADLDLPVPAGVPRSHAVAVGSAEDTAVLLAHEGGAALVVTCGVDESLNGVLDRSASAGSVPLLLRLRGGGAQVAATALSALPRRRVRRSRPTRLAAVAGAALVLGALIGAGPAQSTIERLTGSSGTPVPATVADGSTARLDTRTLQDLVLDGRLEGRTVNVVRLPGAIPAAPVAEALATAGAGVGGVLELTDVYLDPSRTTVLRDLVGQLAPAELADEIEAAPAGADPAAQTDRVLAAVLVTDDAEAVGVVGDDTEPLLGGLARMDAVDVDAETLPVADTVVVLVPEAGDAVSGERVRTLVAALVDVVPAVLVASGGGADAAVFEDPPAEAGGAVGILRADDDAPEVATVDHAGTGTGRVALVLGLAELVDGADPPHYGLAGDASAPAPDVAR